MKILSVEDYVQFCCTGKECPLCCCGGGWKIYIDKKTAQYYETVPGEIGKKIRDAMVDENGDKLFITDKEGNCKLLDKEGLCCIQKELGADKLCLTCVQYPRLNYDFGDILVAYLSNSCPEVTRMILQKDDSLKIVYYDSQDSNMQIPQDTKLKMDYVLSAYSAGINLLQNKEFSIRDRLFLLLFFLERFQQIMEEGENPTNIVAVFSSPETYRVFLKNRNEISVDWSSKIHVFNLVFTDLMKYSKDYSMWSQCKELINNIKSNNGIINDDELTKSLNSSKKPDRQLEEENILTYRFFALFLKGFKENNYFEIFANECIRYAALTTYSALIETQFDRECTPEERIIFYSICSREDHVQNNDDKLINKLREEGYYNLNKLINIIS